MSMKRKAGAAALATASPAAKKSRRQGETSAEVTEKGLELLSLLRETKDKSGKSISTRFESLPDKKKVAEWYEQVTLPLSIEIIQTKLEEEEYSNMTALESDLLRMVINWKEVYDRAAEPHKDADKVKKFITQQMKDNGLNPRYGSDPGYQGTPTPAPEVADDEDEDEEMKDVAKADTPAPEERPRGRIVLRRTSQKVPEAGETPESKPAPRLRLRLGGRRSSRGEDSAVDGDEQSPPAASPPAPKRGRIVLRNPSAAAPAPARKGTPEIKMPEEASKGFQGKSMTDAQDKILEEMMVLEDEDGTSIAGPFVNLPSRELKDYYATIRHPLSIKGAQKLVRGIKGREKNTGTTFLKTWQDFEEEVSYIWNNARIYNEDESEICKLASRLEKYFKQRVELARKSVPDPAPPKIKLSVDKPVEAPARATPNPTEPIRATANESSNKYAIDQDALRRQKQLVANGVVGKLDGTTTSASPAPAQGTPIPTQQMNHSGYPMANNTQQQTPAMLPPSATRPQPTITRPPAPPASEDIKKPWDTWLRSDRPELYQWPYSTIKEVLIVSHPTLELGEKAYRWALYPWKEFNYASHILPMRKESMRILLSPLLIKPTRERPVVYHWVSINGARQVAASSAPRIPGGLATEEDNLYRPVYDLQLSTTEISEILVECYTCPSEVCETKDVIFDKHTIIIQPR